MGPGRSAPQRGVFQLSVAVRRALIGVLGGSAVVATVVQAHGAGQGSRAAQAHRPIEVHSQHYVSSNECRRCHPSEYASWRSSYHRTMTQVATAQTVMGRFDGVTLGESSRYTLGSSGRGFYVDVAAQAGAPAQRRPIALVTGSHHMQIYWYETGHGRTLGQLPFAYLRDDHRWVPWNTIFIEPPAALRPAHEGAWNAGCIACHTTLGQPRVEASGEVDTQVAEFGIACEACHGPGEEHVARNLSPLARYRRHLGGGGDSSIVQPKKLAHRRASYVCGQCHATWLFDGPASMRDWNEHGTAFRPGADPPASAFLMQPSRAAVDPRIAAIVANERASVEAQFWPDGMIRVSGREFNGLVDSPCYQRGELACTSCHALHQHDGDPRPATSWNRYQLAPGMQGDRGCLQCHGEYARSLQQHTRHAPESEGSRCYNCHMPYTTYGLLKALRSHRISVPSVASTLDAGRPNACNLCHLDKTLEWTARQLRDRHRVASPAVQGDWADVPLVLLLGLRGDAAQRALVAWALGWPPARAASRARFAPALLGALMDDPYDAVRYIAQRSLRSAGTDPAAFGYDYVQRPAAREPVAPALAKLAETDVPPEERAGMHALFERLLRERDDRPVQLLE